MSRTREYARLIRIAARRYHVGPHVLAGLIEVESGFNPSATSPAGAQGITQFMPGTAKGYGVKYGTSHGAVASQILGAAHYLHDLGYRKGNRELALASYNAGPGNPSAGMGYASDVLQAAKRYYKTGFFRGVGGGGTAPGGGGGTPPRGGGGTSSVAPSAPGGTGVADILKQLHREGLQSVPVTAPAPPSFMAQGVLPKGYQAPPASEPGLAKQSIEDLLSQVGGIRGASPLDVAGGGAGGGRQAGATGGGGTAAVGHTKVELAPGADRAGVTTSHYLRRVLSGVDVPFPIVITTGSNHSQYTTSGGVSDHWAGRAADIGMGGDARSSSTVRRKGDLIAGRVLMRLGVPRSRARQMARQGGLFNVNYKGHRWQVIWKTETGGNHYTHVHVGVS